MRKNVKNKRIEEYIKANTVNSKIIEYFDLNTNLSAKQKEVLFKNYSQKKKPTKNHIPFLLRSMFIYLNDQGEEQKILNDNALKNILNMQKIFWE